jgi:hypothetical protein
VLTSPAGTTRIRWEGTPSDHRDKEEKGLVAVERFAGRGITQGDLDRIEGANVAYRIGAAR